MLINAIEQNVCMKNWEHTKNVDWEHEQKKVPYVMLGIVIFILLLSVFLYYIKKTLYS